MASSNGSGPWRKVGAGAALASGGVLVGALLAGSLSATADNSGIGAGDPAAVQETSSTETLNPSATTPLVQADPGGQPSLPPQDRDPTQSHRPGEHLLTGDTESKVRAGALAKYPGATIERLETDSDGVYEAHLVTADGQRVTVEVGTDFAVTGEESGPGGWGGPPPQGGTGGDTGTASGIAFWSHA